MNREYGLYTVDGENDRLTKFSGLLHSDYVVEKRALTFSEFVSGSISFKDFVWGIVSFFKSFVYRVRDTSTGKVIHKSYVISKCFKFTFLKKGQYEIGPCFTDIGYRGQGIYPFVLRQIIDDMGDGVFMLVADSNDASINGVVKAGLTKIGYVKRHRFGLWEIE